MAQACKHQFFICCLYINSFLPEFPDQNSINPVSCEASIIHGEHFMIYICSKSYLARNIKESIYIRVNIRVNNPTLNNNIGKFNLPHIWDRVLLNTKGLNFKKAS